MSPWSRFCLLVADHFAVCVSILLTEDACLPRKPTEFTESQNQTKLSLKRSWSGQRMLDSTTNSRIKQELVLQGGDPTGTGTGGESIYGPTFKDELDSRLQHSGRGILSMANSGPATNGSQFFILYKSARHLDYKHTVFGKVVGGMHFFCE